MRFKERIKGSLLVLKSLTLESDLDLYESWLLDPLVTHFLEVDSATVNRAYLIDWIEKRLDSPTDVVFGVYSHQDGFVGTISLSRINIKRRNAELGIMIGRVGAQSKGLGTEAIKMLVNWSRTELSLASITAGMYTSNRASQRVFFKAGFEEYERIELGLNSERGDVSRVIYRHK